MEMETKIKVEYDNEDWGQWYIVDGVKFTFGWNDSVAEYEMRIKAQSYADFLNGHSQHSESLNKLKEAEDVLQEAKLQIEYLHGKFKETGSGNSVLNRIDIVLKSIQQ